LTEPGVQIVFLDTPGVHQPRNELSQFMIGGIQDALKTSDLALFLLDLSQGIGEEEELAVRWLRKYNRPILLALNKTDVTPYPEQLILERKAQALGRWPRFKIQASTGQGIQELQAEMRKHLPEQPPIYPEDQLTDQNVRDLAAELIREQCFHQLKREIPYGVAVAIEKFEEKEPPQPVVITATVYVEKRSHKGILIGVGGRQLKSIGAAARIAMEQLIGQRVFLQLWVKVAKNWRKDRKMMERLGFP
jgi:GTP-binding protein Era